jgi:hypothetical protein
VHIAGPILPAQNCSLSQGRAEGVFRKVVSRGRKLSPALYGP